MLDIFIKGSIGVLWLDTAEDLEDARAKVRKLFASKPGTYFIFDLATQTKHVVAPEDMEKQAPD